MTVGDDPTPLRFQRPALPSTAAIDRYLARSRLVDQYSNNGPCCELLAERVAERVGGGAHVAPVSSGTSALLVALRAVCPPGADRTEVLMPSFTFVAAAHAALALGLKPVFVDIDERTWHLSPERLSAAIGRRKDRVAAVIACTAFGTPPPAQQRIRWEEIARDAGVPLIVDSAAGFGAVADDGRALGLQGDVEVFSMHATKPLAIGEGGLIVSREPAIIERCRRLANFGFDEHRTVSGAAGLNSKLSEVHCAVGLAALDGLDQVLERRRAAAATMSDHLSAAGFSFQAAARRGTWQFVPTLVPPERSPVEVSRSIADAVETRRYYEPLNSMKHLAGFDCEGGLANTEAVFAGILCLPMWPDMHEQTAETIASAVTDAVGQAV